MRRLHRSLLQEEFQKDSFEVLLDGPAGPIESLVDTPGQRLAGIAVIAHPQPLLGGSANHKIPQILARSLRDLGWMTVRPNFRGVGQTAGQHDGGIGETEDLVAIIAELRNGFSDLPLALIGFSFGAFVQSRVARRLEQEDMPASHVVLAGLPVGSVEDKRHYPTEAVPAGSLVIHGEHDERVSLGNVLNWARPHLQPVVVVPGADHFFSGKLAVLRALVISHLQRIA